MDRGWLAEWRNAVQEAIEGVLVDFEDRYGYPPGDNQITDPDPPGVSRLMAACPGVPQDLLTLYANVGAVSLGDIGNGLWVRDAHEVARSYAAGDVRRVTGRHEADVIVFASDGGGTLYAMALPSGSPIYRLPPDGIMLGVYESDSVRFEAVADNLAGFLDQARLAVLRFAPDGTVTDI